jgi:hypothetical protein
VASAAAKTMNGDRTAYASIVATGINN